MQFCKFSPDHFHDGLIQVSFCTAALLSPLSSLSREQSCFLSAVAAVSIHVLCTISRLLFSFAVTLVLKVASSHCGLKTWLLCWTEASSIAGPLLL